MNYRDFKAVEELSKKMAREVAAEIDREILTDINTIMYDASVASCFRMMKWSCSELVTDLFYLAVEVIIDTGDYLWIETSKDLISPNKPVLALSPITVGHGAKLHPASLGPDGADYIARGGGGLFAGYFYDEYYLVNSWLVTRIGFFP